MLWLLFAFASSFFPPWELFMFMYLSFSLYLYLSINMCLYLCTATADRTVRFWDPTAKPYALTKPGAVAHVRVTPGECFFVFSVLPVFLVSLLSLPLFFFLPLSPTNITIFFYHHRHSTQLAGNYVHMEPEWTKYNAPYANCLTVELEHVCRLVTDVFFFSLLFICMLFI